jgi:beta-glucanase (GH16 family)
MKKYYASTFIAALSAVFFASFGETSFAATNTFNEKTIKQWSLKGSLTNSPVRKTEALPLSDQENKSGWIKSDDVWDEFDQSALDTNKWTVGMAWWQGRQPAWFSPKNVEVRDGQLRLTMRKEAVPEQMQQRGYHDYTSAALHAKVRSFYGYYEVKARPMNSGGSSSFWFQNVDEKAFPKWSTEIDVFELCGKSATHDRRDYMTVHVFSTPDEKRHWQIGTYWESPKRLAENFHVYGFEWNPSELRWFVDGVLVRTVENTQWHQPLFLTFDSETMPEWFGMPNDSDLPSTFSVDYVHAWKK